MQEKFICETCGESFKADNDLQAHHFNNKHCPPILTSCPECLTRVSPDELNVFGGLCESCATEGQ